MLKVLRGATLVAATLATGLQAGLYYAFAVSVMPGLNRVDDRAFIETMQQINVAILNPWFFLSFFGAPVLTIVAAGLYLPPAVRATLPWIVAALVLNGVGFVLTPGMNVPLNDTLAAAGPPDQIADLAQVRASFEAAWVRWNIARAIAFTAAFGCLTWASVIYGRIRAGA
ncbi:MAG: DUF1772 domain-containing protein [Pseudonocardiaceae bacterium]